MDRGFVIVPRSFAFACLDVSCELSGEHKAQVGLLGVMFESLPRLGVCQDSLDQVRREVVFDGLDALRNGSRWDSMLEEQGFGHRRG